MAAATPAPPPTDRRCRRRGSRDVSSRYLSTPAAPTRSSSPTDSSSPPKLPPPPPLPTKYHPYHLKPRSSSPVSDSASSSSFADENQTPFIQINATATNQRRVIRLFHDANADKPLQPRKPRPGTPMLHTQRTIRTAGSAVVKRTATPGSKSDIESLAQANPFGYQNSLPETCDSPPLNNCRVRVVSELRSSMPEAELLPTVSVRRSVDGGSGEECSGRLSSCHRSLSSGMLNSQVPFNPGKSFSRPPSIKAVAGLGLPPQWQNSVAAMEQRKLGRKVSTRQEDVHSLRMHHNRLLQWRFANAKALAAEDAKRKTAEKSLCGASIKIEELRESVALKRIELEKLKREENLSTIIEAQMPRLHEWELLERDYSSCLSGAINALQDASVRLPVTGNVKADIGELKETLESATNLLEAISLNAGKFLPQAEALEAVTADLAKVVSTEKALVEECGDLLSLAQDLQVKECSLRTQLMQLKHTDERERTEGG